VVQASRLRTQPGRLYHKNMAKAVAARNASDRLLELVGRLERQEGFAEVIAALKAGQAATLDGVWGSSCALVAAAMVAHAAAPLVVVCPHLDDVDPLVADLGLFLRLTPEQFPACESLNGERAVPEEAVGERVRLLKRLRSPEPPRLVATSIQALLQPVPDRASLARQTRTLRVGQRISLEELAGWLVQNRFHNTTAVELPGEFSVRGGILDIFTPDGFDPVRLELFGDEIESIRRFEVSNQRSLGNLEAVDVTVLAGLWPLGGVATTQGVAAGSPHRVEPVSNATLLDKPAAAPVPYGSRGSTGNPNGRAAGHFADFLPSQSWFLLVEPGEIQEQGAHYLQRLERPQDLHSVAAVFEHVCRFPSVTTSAVAAGSLETTCRLKIESVERFSGHVDKIREELDDVGAGQEVFLVCQTEAEIRRLADLFAATRLAQQGRLYFPLGALHNGFCLVSEQIVLLSSGELFRRSDLTRPARRRLGRVIDSFLDLHEGDLVVHVGHGIARYRGLKLLEKNGQVEEHLELEFQGRTKLYVPTTKIGLVQKYVGGSKGRPMLARLGGHTWGKQKEKVQAAVSDMAADMLQLQAARATRPGISFRVDTEWQQQFDASFPYKETADQLTTIAAVGHDMSQPRPMDRLLCGDVGYGKTEVAMRAAFKAVDAGYQVAVLVPTTILAEQHLRTFTARMAEFPIQIAALSRFATRKEQGGIVAGLADGSIDIVVGTHRLAQPDIRFHNLGLVIIDEEQRFGVEVKERLKALRHTVDVLTMTATPIPRTLHMSLLGLRDISNLETPPEDRLAVETRVTRFNGELIRHAVMRELNRGGQIFFVHNRVQDIQVLAKRLGQIVPEANLGIAHGQMPENDLERVMLDFVAHRFDLLLATTIVESGLDIPNANTIFIDEADRYGLADLHQLRGRVGRYKHRAYCYLLVDPNKNLSPTAAKRLHAIEEFSDMGAGFAIAMRDLEIRGAGNILGTEQSGHIAIVGYELYCALLEQAVAELKRLPPKTFIEVDVDLPGQAYIPQTYVSDMRPKIDLYRRLARIATRSELEDFGGELLDRFGPPPPVVEQLLGLAELRIAAHRWQIDTIHLEDQYVVFTYTSAGKIRELAAQSGGALRVVDGRSAYLPLNGSAATPADIRSRVKSLLQSN
jgi:transcription-repair coupling factor (superfamily II helicase)